MRLYSAQSRVNGTLSITVVLIDSTLIANVNTVSTDDTANVTVAYNNNNHFNGRANQRPRRVTKSGGSKSE